MALFMVLHQQCQNYTINQYYDLIEFKFFIRCYYLSCILKLSFCKSNLRKIRTYYRLQYTHEVVQLFKRPGH